MIFLYIRIDILKTFIDNILMKMIKNTKYQIKKNHELASLFLYL